MRAPATELIAKAGEFRDQLAAACAIGEDFGDAMRRLVQRPNLRERRDHSFSLRGPTSRRHRGTLRLALHFRDACIEAGGLTSVGFGGSGGPEGQFGDDLRG